MKKLLLVMVIATLALSVSAQRDNRNNDQSERYHYKDSRDDRYDLQKNNKNKRELKRQLAAINRDYDARINSIRRNHFIRGRIKDRKIRDLEIERRVALNDCQDRFSGIRHRDVAGERRGKW